MTTEKWKSPSDIYKTNVIQHRFDENYKLALDAIEDFNFAGVVTNVPFDNGFTSNADNVAFFEKIATEMQKRALEYWVYDEVGYPSGQAGGKLPREIKEFAAKGLYMRKYEAFLEDIDFDYEIDGISDCIAYAVQYKQDLSDVCEAKILFETAKPLDYTKRKVRVCLKPGEICYIFIVKDAYEGSHCVHNISSRKKYINLLSEDAVEKFIQIAYEPIVKDAKNAFSNANAVFTDEPSLMVGYARDYETFNYALVPYEKTLFDKFEKKYGYDVKPYLPLLFENTNEKCYSVRRDFYDLIGDVVANNYSKKIQSYCKEHGTRLSGHYLAEENVWEHVMYYGNYVSVLKETGYPGMDILQCTPEDFFHNAPKFLEMIARKKKTNGYMVEFCPFFNKEVFDRAPFENAIGSMGLLYMNGARKINTYFLPRLSEYDERIGKGGSMSRAQSVYLNDYVGRLGEMLCDKRAVYDTYVYYAIEDVQAKFKPKTVGAYAKDAELSKLDNSLTRLAKSLENGGRYGFVDEQDLTGGFSDFQRIVVPDVDFISAKTVKALRKLSEDGKEIFFINGYPKNILGEEGEDCSFGKILSYAEWDEKQSAFTPKGIFLQSFDERTEMMYNNNKTETVVVLKNTRRVYDVDTGETYLARAGDEISLKAYRAVFLVED